MVHSMLSLLTYLIFSTHAWSVKRKGHSLIRKNMQISRLLWLLHSSAVMLINSAVLQYCGYRDSPTGNCVLWKVTKYENMLLKKCISLTSSRDSIITPCNQNWSFAAFLLLLKPFGVGYNWWKQIHTFNINSHSLPGNGGIFWWVILHYTIRVELNAL